jgi:hypothetical protein
MLFRSFTAAQTAASQCLAHLQQSTPKKDKYQSRYADIQSSLITLVNKLELNLCEELWKDYSIRYDMIQQNPDVATVLGEPAANVERQVDRAIANFLQIELVSGAMKQYRSPKILRRRSDVQKAGWTLVTCKDTAALMTVLLDELIDIEEVLLIYLEYVPSGRRNYLPAETYSFGRSQSDSNYIPAYREEFEKQYAQNLKNPRPSGNSHHRQLQIRSSTMRPIVDLKSLAPTRSQTWRREDPY